MKMMREKTEIDERSKGIKKATAVPKIAPVEFSTFSDKQLEMLIRHQLKKYPTLLKHRKYVVTNPESFKVTKKRATGPRMTNAKNFSKNAEQNEYERVTAPGPTTYKQDDRILHEKLRDQAWAKMKDERTFNKPVRGDYRKQLLPDLDAVKPKAKGAFI